MRPVVVLFLSAALFQADALSADQASWPWWRGPLRNGHAAEANPPEKFGGSRDENLVWKTPVPGRGHSSPVVDAGKVFLATADESAQTHSVVCYELDSGKQLWQTEVNQGGFPARNHPKNTEASPTIACDGTHVFIALFHHRQVELIAVSYDGQIAWRKKVADFNPKKYEYGYAPSPTIYDSLVIVSAEYDGPSFLVAYDRESGQERWRTPRAANITFSTPVVAKVGRRDLLLLSGSGQVAAYDPATGKQRWSTPGTTAATCGTMVWDKGVVVASGGYPKSETIALDASGGDVLWRNDKKCYEQSMIIVDRYVYGLTDRGILYCWLLSNGREMWRHRLSGPVSASPVYAGGKVYWANEGGSVFVFKPSNQEYIEVAENRVGDSLFASPAVVGNRLLIRAGVREGGKMQEYLYCFGS